MLGFVLGEFGDGDLDEGAWAVAAFRRGDSVCRLRDCVNDCETEERTGLVTYCREDKG